MHHNCQTNKIKHTDMIIEKAQLTLVDQVEERLLLYFKERSLVLGDGIPNETTLAAELGVARSVLREALSRLRMMGVINSRPRRGMVLSEPSLFSGIKKVLDPTFLSKDTLLNLLEFRIAIETGVSGNLFKNITSDDIKELEDIVRIGQVSENNAYTSMSEMAFHTKLYKITGNKIISEFQHIIYPVLEFVKQNFNEYLRPINIELKKNNQIVTHADLLEYIKNHDLDGYRKAIEKHFLVYTLFIEQYKNEKR